jgi:hypothetical protein
MLTAENKNLSFNVVVVQKLLTVLKFWWRAKCRVFLDKNELLVWKNLVAETRLIRSKIDYDTTKEA